MKRNAFLILAHSDPVHLKRLVDRLGQGNDVYIHIDRKADLAEFKDMLGKPGVFFTERRYWVIWAGISMVDAILELMKAAVSSGNDYGHIGILTGADYPLKKMNIINSILMQNPNREYIKFSKIYDNPDYTRFIENRHFREPFIYSKLTMIDKFDRLFRKMLSFIGLSNHWRKDVIPYRGHTWCVLTLECCRYILEFVDNNPWYHEMNVRTFAPDEHYFHTIVANSPFAAYSGGLQPFQGSLSTVGETHMIDDSLVHARRLGPCQRLGSHVYSESPNLGRDALARSDRRESLGLNST